MSLRQGKWRLLNNDSKLDLEARLLLNRGVSDRQKFLQPDFATGLYDPYLLPDIPKALERIRKALNEHEKVLVIGDYDMDGISATVLLLDFFPKIGLEVAYRLPDRLNEGYGLNQQMVVEAKEQNFKLVVTVDNGISALGEIQALQEAGIDVILTDHHAIPAVVPPAFAIIHTALAPEYPFKDLSGVGIAYKLVQALARSFLPAEEAESYLRDVLDLVALGTVADCVNLQDENRVLVKHGLEVLAQTKRVGLQALLRQAEITPPLSSETIGYRLAPRLNAAGRLKAANLSVELLLAKDPSRAEAQALDLEKLNKERQELTEKLIALAEQGLDQKEHKIIIAKHPDFHAGVVGLVAGRLCEKYALPVVILEEAQDLLTASCRSPEWFNIIEAVTTQAELLERFGGHKQAAGFTMKPENFSELKERLEKLYQELCGEQEFLQELLIDSELQVAELRPETVTLLKAFEPYGIGNLRPSFLLRDFVIQEARSVGSTGQHLKLKLKKDNKFLDTIGFRLGQHALKLSPGSLVDVVGYLELNEWNGKVSLQLNLIDLEIKV